MPDEAIQHALRLDLDCRVAALLAMTLRRERRPLRRHSREGGSLPARFRDG